MIRRYLYRRRNKAFATDLFDAASAEHFRATWQRWHDSGLVMAPWDGRDV